MNNEMAFLKYRLDVVQAWPDSSRKKVFLTAIESRIIRVRHVAACPKSEQIGTRTQYLRSS